MTYSISSHFRVAPPPPNPNKSESWICIYISFMYLFKNNKCQKRFYNKETIRIKRISLIGWSPFTLLWLTEILELRKAVYLVVHFYQFVIYFRKSWYSCRLWNQVRHLIFTKFIYYINIYLFVILLHTLLGFFWGLYFIRGFFDVLFWI